MSSTSLKRASLEDAYDAAVAAQRTLRVQLRLYETEARKSAQAARTYKSISANGRQTVNQDVSGATDENVNLWRELIDLHDQGKAFLDKCTLYNLDPDAAELDGMPSPLPAPVNNPAAVSDATLKTWMLAHLIAVTEFRHDHSSLRVA